MRSQRRALIKARAHKGVRSQRRPLKNVNKLSRIFFQGTDGQGLNRIICLNQSSIVSDASRVALNVDKSNFFPIVGINAVSTAESYQLSLVVTTASGVRLYYTTADNNSSNVRPHNLTLQHVRLPPGFAASSPAGRPSKVHMSCYQNGTLLLACAQNESTDQLWVLSGDSFPFQVRSLNSTPYVFRKKCVHS